MLKHQHYRFKTNSSITSTDITSSETCRTATCLHLTFFSLQRQPAEQAMINHSSLSAWLTDGLTDRLHNEVQHITLRALNSMTRSDTTNKSNVRTNLKCSWGLTPQFPPHVNIHAYSTIRRPTNTLESFLLTYQQWSPSAEPCFNYITIFL